MGRLPTLKPGKLESKPRKPEIKLRRKPKTLSKNSLERCLPSSSNLRKLRTTTTTLSRPPNRVSPTPQQLLKRPPLPLKKPLKKKVAPRLPKKALARSLRKPRQPPNKPLKASPSPDRRPFLLTTRSLTS